MVYLKVSISPTFYSRLFHTGEWVRWSLLYVQSTALRTDGGLREALAAYVQVNTSTYKEKKFSAEAVHKEERAKPCMYVIYTY